MKRSKVVEIIAGWGDDSIRNDVYCCDLRTPELKKKQLLEWADNLLYTLETELRFCPVKMDSYGNLESLNYDKEDDNYCGAV